MRILKWIAAAIAVVIALAIALLAFLLIDQPSLEPFDDMRAEARDAPPGAVTVRAMGNTNLLITDGETALMTDGWFTRPSTFAIAFGKIEPDLAAIADGLERGHVGEVAAVIPVHSHFDHAMDAPEVAKRTGALLVGTESTANIGRGSGLAEEQIRVPAYGERLRFGAFTVTLVESRHFVFPNFDISDGHGGIATIDEPLVPPVAALDYKEGGSPSILIEHPRGTLLIQGSAGFIEGALDGVEADVVLLGVGGLTGQTDGYLDAYWREIVTATSPDLVVPIHFDSFTHALGDDWELPSRLWNDVLGLDGTGGIEYVRDRADEAGIEAAILPLWEEIVLY